MSKTEFPSSLLSAIREAAHIAVLTGAGVSAESGIPTFRQAQTGLWAQYDPQELATPAAFRRNHRLVWRWYQWRRELVAGARPNPAHEALAIMERLANRLTLITQNVDGLHQEAGSQRIIELHGNLARNKCFLNDHAVAAGAEIPPKNFQEPPRCPQCDSLLRPDVVWFGEALPPGAIESAFAAAQESDVFLSIGARRPSCILQQAFPLPPSIAARSLSKSILKRRHSPRWQTIGFTNPPASFYPTWFWQPGPALDSCPQT